MDDFVAGTIGGVAGLIVGHPLDTLRVRMQVSTDAVAKGQSGGTLAMLRSLTSQESPLALFKGMMSPMLSRAVNNALFFGVYGLVAPKTKNQEQQRSLWNVALGGAAAGFVPAFIVCPSEFIKCRMQVDRNRMFTAQRSGFVATARSIMRNEGGALTLFRGFGMVILRDVPYSIVYFLVYELAKRRMQAAPESKSARETNTQRFLAGGLAGVAGWTLCYPFDVIKTAIQVSPQKLSALEWSKETYRSRGWRPFYRALSLTLIRSFPVSAVSMLVFEWSKDLMKSRHHDNDEQIEKYTMEKL